MLRTVKPRNARSKRAFVARQPKEVEDPRTCIFVKGTHTGEIVTQAMKELMALKRPNALAFNKKNEVRPFDTASTSETTLEFWSAKNDASLFLIGQSTKKRPNGLTFVRMFDGRVLDIIEFGVEKLVGMAEFKTPKCTPGNKPLLHFASDLFETHPRFIQLKSMLISFFNGETIESICLPGIEHVISITLSPTPTTLTTDVTDTNPEDLTSLPKVHIRAYTIKLKASGTRIPKVGLVPMGPSLDLVLRRHQAPDPDLLKQSLRRPKLKKQDVEKGVGKKRKNMEVDEMGDLRGRVHVGKQDLSKLQTRKMKGLKSRFDEEDVEEMDVDQEDVEGMDVDQEDTPLQTKKQRT
ncbi:Brix-domain-containing protein [Macrolepiota fuliginosa MF-IS2]|uniref:Ribosome production factor 2 homolog n=1 Tax=Macrolepiota fuliginosa MF-IS2 TaxID=1400762 RepID=A0A9P5X6I9_9AGAR|nr:Brix-domain-containing protein [Macrolepiota fuliginosa MF-IS2]